MLGWRLPSLSRPSLRRVLSTAAEGVKGAEGAQGPPGQATIRRAAYEIIRTAPGPIRTRNVVEALKQQPLPPDQMALLSMTHLKKRILKSMKEAEQIRTVAVKVEGKKKPVFGWVLGEKTPSFAKPAQPPQPSA